MDLGKRIKKIREEKGFTQQQIADLLGISLHTMSKYEQGQREPSMDVLGKIASVLDVELFEFMVDKNDLLKKWNLDFNTDRLHKELKLSELLQELYPNDFDFIMDLLARLGLLEKNNGDN